MRQLFRTFLALYVFAGFNECTAAEWEVMDKFVVNGAATFKSSATITVPVAQSASLWVSTSTLTPHLYVSTGGNVGIGTASPDKKLYIKLDPALGVDKFTIDSKGNTTWPTWTMTAPVVDFKNASTIGFGDIDISDPGANEGFGWAGTTAGWTLDVSPEDRSNNDGNLNLYGTANNIVLWRPTNIKGSVGISTGVPQARLDVLAAGSGAADMAQIWRNASGTIMSSMSAAGVMKAVQFIGDGALLTNVSGSPVGSALTSGQIWVGNGSNLAQARTMSGDAALSNTGALTLVSTFTSNTYRSVTVDTKGRVAAGTNPTTFAGYALSDTSANLAATITDETGTAGYAVFSNSPVFSGNVAMPGTGVWNASGNVGIGTVSPAQKLDVSGNINLTGHMGIGSVTPSGNATIYGKYEYGANATRYGLYLTTDISTQAITADRTSYGILSYLDNYNDDSAAFNQNIYGIRSYARNRAARTVNTAVGVNGIVDNTSAAGAINNAYGVYADVNLTAGSIANGYGIYIAPGAGTNRYGIYQNSGGDTNYFGGPVGVGVTGPAAKLDVKAAGTAATDMAQIWRNSVGTIVSSMSATGVFKANHVIGNGAGLTSVDADTVDGLEVHTGTNNEANKIVRTNASGYLYTGWINTTSGDRGTNAISRVYASDDSFVRYYTLPNFTAQVQSAASGTWPISITGSAGSASPDGAALTSARIWVGNSSDQAQVRAVSGDATLSNTGALTLANSGVSAGTYRSLTVDAKGRATAGTNPTTFAGYGLSDTSANLAAAITNETGTAGYIVFSNGPTFTGNVIMPGTGIWNNSGNIGVGRNSTGGRVDVQAAGSAPTDMAQVWRDSGGAIVSSMSATGVMKAVKFIGDGSGLNNVTASLSGDIQSFTASGTWYKPAGGTITRIQCWGGGGGGGGVSLLFGSSGGGGGGGYNEIWLPTVSLGSAEAVTVGAGGYGGTGSGEGGNGGNSSVGGWLVAYGGGGGDYGPDGGGGGGPLSAGVNTDYLPGAPLIVSGSIYDGEDNLETYQGAGGDNAVAQGGVFHGGGGGGSSITGNGGGSIYGGGGGGCYNSSSSQRAGGTSVYGGSGGAGNTSGSPGGNGSQPGGGGGAGNPGGTGGAGKCVVTTF